MFSLKFFLSSFCPFFFFFFFLFSFFPKLAVDVFYFFCSLASKLFDVPLSTLPRLDSRATKWERESLFTHNVLDCRRHFGSLLGGKIKSTWSVGTTVMTTTTVTRTTTAMLSARASIIKRIYGLCFVLFFQVLLDLLHLNLFRSITSRKVVVSSFSTLYKRNGWVPLVGKSN